MNSESDVLNSWKEIAGYLVRGVRTVQRWEHDLQLPVLRPRGKSRSAVIAFRHELDAWLRNAQQQSVPTPLPADENYRMRLKANAAILSKRVGLLKSLSNCLDERLKQLSLQLNHTCTLVSQKPDPLHKKLKRVSVGR